MSQQFDTSLKCTPERHTLDKDPLVRDDGLLDSAYFSSPERFRLKPELVRSEMLDEELLHHCAAISELSEKRV